MPISTDLSLPPKPYQMKEQAQKKDDQGRRDGTDRLLTHFSSLGGREDRREGEREGGLQQANMMKEDVGKVQRGGHGGGRAGRGGGEGCSDKRQEDL